MLLEIILNLLTQPDHYWVESLILNILGFFLWVEQLFV